MQKVYLLRLLRPLFRSNSVNFRQHCRNLSRKAVLLIKKTKNPAKSNGTVSKLYKTLRRLKFTGWCNLVLWWTVLIVVTCEFWRILVVETNKYQVISTASMKAKKIKRFKNRYAFSAMYFLTVPYQILVVRSIFVSGIQVTNKNRENV